MSEDVHVRYVWPAELHVRVKAEAALAGVSMQEWVLGAVLGRLGGGSQSAAGPGGAPREVPPAVRAPVEVPRTAEPAKPRGVEAPRTAPQVKRQVEEGGWAPRGDFSKGAQAERGKGRGKK
jgi:hypothetical protein